MKENKFLDFLQENRNFQVIFFICVMSCLFVFYIFTQNKIYDDFEIIDDNFSWVYQVDSVKIEKNTLLIDGWAFKLEHDAEKKAYDIILYEIDSKNFIVPKMIYTKRADVNQYFLCEYDYIESGFSASFSIDDLSQFAEKAVYQILIKPRKERIAYASNVYYSDGEIYFTNPRDYVPLEVAGTALEEIVLNGILRVYHSDVGMYVYQYNNELYWIAERCYEKIGLDTILQYQISTTQVECLPEWRKEKKFTYDNKGFIFSDYVIEELCTEKYFVAKREIPNEYSVTKIWTGYYVENWIWKEVFQPWYGLD